MPKVSGAISNIVSGAMSAASRAQSTAQSGATAQDAAQAKLDKENREIRRKAIDEALKMGNHMLAKKLMEGAPPGVDVSLFQTIIDTPSPGQQQAAGLLQQLIGGTGPPTPSAAPPSPFLPSSPPESIVSTIGAPAPSQVATSLAPKQDLLEKWSVSVASGGKVTFTSRKPKTPSEQVKAEYIDSLDPDARMELGQAMVEGATTITQEKTKLPDGSIVEQTIGRRAGKIVSEGPVRQVEPSTKTQLAQKVTAAEATTLAKGRAAEKLEADYAELKSKRAVERKIAEAEAVPASVEERAHKKYVEERELTSAPILDLAEWRLFNTIAGQNLLLARHGAPRDSAGKMLTNIAEEGAGKVMRARKSKTWMKAYALAQHYGVSKFTLDNLTLSIFSDLHLRDNEIEDAYAGLIAESAKYRDDILVKSH